MAASDIDRLAIGRRIKTMRLSREMTVQQLAQKAGMSPGYLSEVERGKSVISSEKLARLASALSVSLNYLLTGEDGSPSSDLRVPNALSEAAEQLGLSYSATKRLLEGRRSLVARRSTSSNEDWDTTQWIEFYRTVKNYIDD